MSQYEKITREIRANVSRLSLEQQKQLEDMYTGAINNLSRVARNSRSRTLSRRWVYDYLAELTSARDALRRGTEIVVTDGINRGAQLGSEGQEIILGDIFTRSLGVDTSFSGMFSQVNDNVVRDIISGDLYTDNKSLSGRIWTHGQQMEKDIQSIISEALLEKKSAVELADDLDEFVKGPQRRSTDWGKSYPNLRNRKVDYNAMRLARTSLNHAYQNATVQSSVGNPFIKGIEWRSVLAHGRTCELCRQRHGQIYTVDSIPLDHPNGLCSYLPYIPQSMEEIGEELGDWVNGESNEVLDAWYEEYGEYMIIDMEE